MADQVRIREAIDGAERFIRGVTQWAKTDQDLALHARAVLDDVEWLAKFAQKIYDATEVDFELSELGRNQIEEGD